VRRAAALALVSGVQGALSTPTSRTDTTLDLTKVARPLHGTGPAFSGGGRPLRRLC